jgi:hypothetical protein
MKISFIAAAFVVCVSATCHAATLRFDFGESAQQTPNYNNVLPAQEPILNALDITGAGTGIGMTAAGFNEAGPNAVGTQSPTGTAAIFASTATRDSLFGHSSNFNVGGPRPTALLTFTGLDGSGATNYEFTFFASRTDTSANPNNRETRYQVAGSNNGEALLNPANNSSNVAIVSGITPTAAGEISVTLSAGSNNNNPDGFFYLGAMQLVSSAVVPEPTTLGLFSLASVFALAVRRGR